VNSLHFSLNVGIIPWDTIPRSIEPFIMKVTFNELTNGPLIDSQKGSFFETRLYWWSIEGVNFWQKGEQQTR